MIELSRTLAGRFRSVVRSSLMEGRRDWPLVHCRAGPKGLTLEARQGDVAVRYFQEGNYPDEALAFRASVLAECEGRSDEPVRIEQVAFGKGRARWTEGGAPQVAEIETVTPDSVSPFPEAPQCFTAQPDELLHALGEAARTTAREAGRFSLTHLQLRGRKGEVVATDGQQLLVQGGFAFPWPEDLLVPRVLAFGSRDLDAREQSVGVGRTDRHVAVRVGPWLFLLRIDQRGRFPDVLAVVPRPHTIQSRLRFDPADAAFLARLLPKLPGRDGQHDAVTLDLGQPPAVRARPKQEGTGTEVVLARSSTLGPPVRLNTDRRYLYRALRLGFREVEVAGADRPLACREAQRLFVWMPLGKENVIPPSPDLRRLSSEEVSPVASSVPCKAPSPQRRKVPMPPPSSHQDTPANGMDGPTDRGPGLADLIEEAEALRAALADATGRATRLLAALKQQKRQSRALEAAVATLRQLRLGP